MANKTPTNVNGNIYSSIQQAASNQRERDIQLSKEGRGSTNIKSEREYTKEITKQLEILKQHKKYMDASLSDKKEMKKLEAEREKSLAEEARLAAIAVKDIAAREKLLREAEEHQQKSVEALKTAVKMEEELNRAYDENVSLLEKKAAAQEKISKYKKEESKLEKEKIEKLATAKTKEEKDQINSWFKSATKDLREKMGLNKLGGLSLKDSVGAGISEVMNGGSFSKGLETVFSTALGPIGVGVKAALSVLSAISGVLSGISSKLDTGVESALSDQQSYLSKINSRLQGSNVYYDTIVNTLTSNFGDKVGSPFISQKKAIENIAKLVDSGVAVNIEERGVLMTLSDRMVSTFDALDANLTRMIRIQQADITGTQLGYEAELTQFLNEQFMDTSYLNNMYDSVSAALLDASSQLDYNSAGAFNFAVQKWLGSLYSVGLSDQAISTIAQGINYLATGNVEALNSNDSLRNLFAMASGGAFSGILTGGLNADSVNVLLQNVVQYLQQIAGDNNQVTKQARAGIFGGLSLSDIRAISNLSANDIGIISSKTANAQSQLRNQLSQAVTTGGTGRVGLSELYETALDNVLYSFGNSFIQNTDAFKTWKVSSYLQGLNIPLLSDAAGLSKSIDLLFNGGISTLWNLFKTATNVITSPSGGTIDYGVTDADREAYYLDPYNNFSPKHKDAIMSGQYDKAIATYKNYMTNGVTLTTDNGTIFESSPSELSFGALVGEAWKNNYWTAGGKGSIYNNLIRELTSYSGRGGATSVSSSGIVQGFTDSLTVGTESIAGLATPATSQGSSSISGGYSQRDITDLYNELFDKQSVPLKVYVDGIGENTFNNMANAMAMGVNSEAIEAIANKVVYDAVDVNVVGGNIGSGGSYGGGSVVNDIDTGLSNVKNSDSGGSTTTKKQYEAYRDLYGNKSKGGCFVAGTLITMADGSLQPIETIVVGDMVLAFNCDDNTFEPREVSKSYVHKDTPRVIDVIFSNGLTLGMTPGHPIYTTEGWKSRDIENSLYEHGVVATMLNIGDEIVGMNNSKITVVSIEERSIPEHYYTYNIEVESNHTYAAGGIVVHNAMMVHDAKM